MSIFTRRADRPACVLGRPAPLASSGLIRDEMSLLGLGADAAKDPLDRLSLASRPEAYFASGLCRSTHEVL